MLPALLSGIGGATGPPNQLPRKPGGGDEIEGQAEIRPPGRNARIGDQAAAEEVEQAMHGEPDGDEPLAGPEANHRDAGEGGQHHALGDERRGGAGHDREQVVIGGDDDQHRRVEGAIAVEAGERRERRDAERQAGSHQIVHASRPPLRWALP